MIVDTYLPFFVGITFTMLTEMRVAKVNISQELISTIRKISEKKVEVTDQENVNEDVFVFDPKEAEKYGNFPVNQSTSFQAFIHLQQGEKIRHLTFKRLRTFSKQTHLSNKCQEGGKIKLSNKTSFIYFMVFFSHYIYNGYKYNTQIFIIH